MTDHQRDAGPEAGEGNRPVKFRVLGPVSVIPRTPTAAKVRVLLAVLLLRANEVVPTDSLIDEVWDIAPPRTVTTTLQVYVSQLRTILTSGLPAGSPRDHQLHTVPPGYRLRVAPDDLDLSLFEALRRSGKDAYDRGDFAEAARLLRQGLGLWTGLALSGVPHGPMLSTAVVRLEELRISTLELRLGADLRLGRHRELTGELMALVGEHPYREALHAHLMVSLYRSDRQSDALQAFARARKSLVDELGVEPGPGLRRLHERVLRSDPGLAWRDPAAEQTPAATVVRMPPPLTDFTGREEVLGRAAKLVPDATRTTSSGVLAIGGRAGVGKTALAVELARRTADSFPHGRVLVQLRGPQGAALDAVQTMTQLLWALEPSAVLSGVRPALPTDIRELGQVLQHTLQDRRLLIVLDDATSEEQLRPVLDSTPTCFVVVTSRRTLAGLDGARHLTLDELKPAEAQRLLAGIAGSAIAEDPSAAQEIARRCGYLPLALRVAGATLTARPHWSAAALADRLADASDNLDLFVLGDLDVRASLLVGHRELSDTEQQAFRLLALAPASGFELWAAARLLGISSATAERIAERLVDSQLLSVRRSTQGRSPRYSYHRLLHALAREQLAANETPEARRAATGRLGAAYLSLARHADGLLAPGRVDYTRRRGSGPARPPQTAEARGPADVRAAIGESPAQWIGEELEGMVDVVQQAHSAGLWQLVWELTEALTGYFEAAAQWDHWAATHELALDAARRAECPEARAAVLQSLGDLAWQQRRTRRSREYYESARALHCELGDQRGEARCLVGAADVALSEGDVEYASQLYAQASELLGAGDDQRGQADVLRGQALVELQRGQAESALQGFTEFADASERLGDRRWARFGYRSTERILEHMVDWHGSQRMKAPLAVETRPGVWLVRAPAA